MFVERRKVCLMSMMIYYLNFILLSNFYTVLASSDSNICGPKENFLFCNCDSNENALDATCYTINDQISSNDPQWQLFSSQPSLERLKLSGFNQVSLKHFPTALFKLKTIRDSLHDVILSDLYFKTLPTGAFQNMSQLKLVEISFCPNMVIEKNAFDHLVLLEKIVMNKNNLSSLPNMFRHVPLLRELYLEDNNIETFEANTFIPLKNLTYLTLDKNKIHTIEAQNFNGLINLNMLELRANKIKNLPARVFHEMANLEILDLSYNQIETINEETFAGLSKLQELRLEHNKLNHIGTQLQTLTNLIEVNLDSNQLQAISKYSFYRPGQKRYVHIKIRNNQLYCNCQLFWLKEAFESDVESRNYNEMSKCYLGSNSYSDQSVVKFLLDNVTSEQCTLPQPPTSPTNDDDSETLPIETIDSVEGIGHLEVHKIDGSSSVEEEFKNRIKQEYKQINSHTNNRQGDTELNLAKLDRNQKQKDHLSPNSNSQDNTSGNGVQSINLLNSVLSLHILIIITLPFMNI